MAALGIVRVTPAQVREILALTEGHFVDLKSTEITPAKLTRTIAALSNSEGGELYVGVEDAKRSGRQEWAGFKNPEDANGFIQAFEGLFPLGEDYSYTFLGAEGVSGLVLKVDVRKTRDVKQASDGKVYVRRGAQNLPLQTEEELNRLRRNKGITSFETEPVNAPAELITNSATVIGFMLQVVPAAEPEAWLKKQMLLVGDKPTVAGLVLFADEPQVALPKRTGIKLYRYKTSAPEGTRETLDFHPLSVDGPAYEQIRVAVERTVAVVEGVRVNTVNGLETVSYPLTALHEVITNAVLHRDYSIADDIHIRIFDNRVEVVSPGTLPAHITPENILEERFARNAALVRLINKFPDPPNQDVGEGLNTAFEAMREMRLKPPVVAQDGGSVRVILRHESLATPEELILEFLQSNPQIANRQARAITYIGSENRVKVILQRMVRKGILELVPNTTRYTAAYRLASTDGATDPV